MVCTMYFPLVKLDCTAIKNMTLLVNFRCPISNFVCRQQWRLLPVPDVRRILRRLAGVYVRRMDQQADILACFVHLHDLYSYVHVYFRLHRSCGLCHGLRGCVDNDVLQGDLCRPCCVCFLSPSSSR